MPGVRAVVRDGSFVGVVADTEWHAELALRRLREAASWEDAAPRLPDESRLVEWLKSAASELALVDERKAARPVAVALFQALPDKVSIYEVSPRDGLQNEAVTVPTTHKARLIEALVSAGVSRIEVTSFVSPKWIPQLADAEEVMRMLPPGAAQYSALCPNARGLERAKKCGIPELAVFVSASESHNRRNVNDTIGNTLARFRDVIAPAVAYGLRVRGYVSRGRPRGGVDPAPALGLLVGTWDTRKPFRRASWNARGFARAFGRGRRDPFIVW
jgi:hypothetical protein